MLSGQELKELSNAYQNIKSILSSMPTSLDDFFENRRQYMEVCKWSALLAGRKWTQEEEAEIMEGYEEEE